VHFAGRVRNSIHATHLIRRQPLEVLLRVRADLCEATRRDELLYAFPVPFEQSEPAHERRLLVERPPSDSFLRARWRRRAGRLWVGGTMLDKKFRRIVQDIPLKDTDLPVLVL
jgi:hypothetical protein